MFDKLQATMSQGPQAGMQRLSSEELQEDQCEEEQVCEDQAVSKVPQEHQDNLQGDYQEQLPDCPKKGVQNILLQ